MSTQNKSPLFLIGGGVMVFVIALFVILTSLSGSIVDNSLKEIQVFTDAKKDTVSKEERYIEDVKSQNAIIGVALKKAKFEDGFKKSKSLVKASAVIVTKMNAFIEKDDHNDEDALTALMLSLRKNSGEILKNNSSIVSKKNGLVNLIKNIGPISNKIQKDLTMNKYQTEATIVILKKNADEHPAKKVDIDGKLKKANDNLAKNMNFSEVLTGQIDHKEYVAAYNTIKEVGLFITSVSKENSDYRKLMDQLSKSYSKILVDMKRSYYASVGMSTWDEWSDYDTTTNFIFPPVEVTEKDLEVIDTATGTIANGNPTSPSGTHPAWSILRGKISPKAQLVGGHDSSEFWVDNVMEKYYHKYIIVESTKKTETGWVEVTADAFKKNYNDLGMEIVSKPYGKYESEKSTVAVPPGMGTVGNSRYGEWRNDNSGNSFWHYYGMYSFWGNIHGGNSYSRNDYDHYRNHRKTAASTPYYGSNKQYGTFGSSTRNNERYSNSSHMQTNKSNTQRGASSRTIRSAGKNSRGRGAAGGGK